MNVIDAINSRRSIRSFSNKPVEFEKLTEILNSGAKAPSSGNLKDYKFIVVTNKELIIELANLSQEQYWIAQASVVIVVLSDFAKVKEYYKERGERLYSVQSCAAATQNMLLTAHSLDLAACWVGAFDELKLNTLLGIKGDVRPQAIIPIGYPDERPLELPEVELDTLVYFNTYGEKVENMNLLTREYHKEIKKEVDRISTKSKGVDFNKIKDKLLGFFKK